ncbi:sensor histidine kinase [Helcobacillus massiliensis]|uniref:sensor histidine kinase n=1 Tax=Helcobacillus massiliensis TaxID=521392 RepID=UPI0025569EAC|nr:HAMP domain-containing sensor histidine kinase [Helcobacillus massiliensis]MDK7742454.1 HAMP domain-containing sensor histidine kinase [Helcobacillus massiliensis]WOO92461.1 HAMP domain-containing sensor histidine kinase [Helcobacillus massiliensis]
MKLGTIRPGQRSKRPVSLWTRVVTLIASVLVLGTLVTGSLSLFLLNRTLIQSIDEDLRRSVGPTVSLATATINDQNADPNELAYAPVDFVVEFRSADGDQQQKVVRNRTNQNADIRFPHLSRDEVQALNREPFTVLDSEQQRWRVLAIASDQPDGYSAFVALPMVSVDSTMNEMALIIVLVGTSVVLTGVGIGGWVSHRALEPLRDVESTAREIAAGSLSRRVPVSTTSQEVHTLAVVLNEMLVRLEGSFQAQAKSESKAISSESKMRRFVGDASHELRTPLAAIRGFGELYRMGALRSDDDVASAMKRIEDEAQRMGSLVENLLRLARLDEQQTFDLLPMDITPLIHDATQDLRALDPTRDVQITDLTGAPLDIEEIQPTGVLGDEAGLRQVILNLVGNTNRHTPKGTPVEIALGHNRKGNVLLEVRDHGDGIPQEARERVFERFFRTDESRQRQSEQGGGAGLGLAIAATIMEHHHGMISIHQTDGGGATFRVEIPSADLDDDGASPADSGDSTGSA